MEIKTRFAIGETIWTVRDCKAVSIKIGCVLYDGVAVYYGADRYSMTPEAQCFATKEELLRHVAA